MKTKDKRNPLRYLFSTLWKYSAGNHRNVAVYSIMFIIVNTVNLVAGPLILAKMMDVVQKKGCTDGSLFTLLGLLGLILVLNFFFWSLHGPGRLLEQYNAFKVRVNYREYLLKGVLTMPMFWHSEHHSGDTIDKIDKGTGSLYRFSEESFEVIYGIVQLMVSYIMLVYFSHSAGIIVLLMIIFTMWITIRFDKVLMEQYKELNRAENQITQNIFDSISNISTVIVLRVEKLIFGTIAERLRKPFELYRKNCRINELKWFLVNTCCSLMFVLVMAVYFIQNRNSTEDILVGNVYILLNYLNKVGDIFFRFAGMYSDIVKYMSKVINSEELSLDFEHRELNNHCLGSNWSTINVSELWFSYDNNGDSAHLDDLTFHIKRGEKIALVGASGSGKTTLLKIVRDLYTPRNIRLEVDGIALEHGFAQIANAIALVPQNPEIFATTILENVTFGASHDMDLVRRFTDMTCFTEVAMALPKGFDSSIREKGVNLSGGEQQRLALARGLLACHLDAKKQILLLDEPTKSLDAILEANIYDQIFKEFQGMTIISSLHNLRMLPLFDRIFMFDDGKIVGIGNLQELLESCPQFRSLYQSYIQVV